MSRKAVQLWERRDHDGALREFKREAQRSRSVAAWCDYATALALSWQGRSAAEAYREARRHGTASVADQAAAERFVGMRRYDLALPFLERLRAAGVAQAHHSAALAVAFDRAGRTGEAEEALAEGCERFGPLPELRLTLAKLWSRDSGKAGEALAILDEVLAVGSASAPVSSEVHYGRAACLEKLGRFDEVFPALRLAKAPMLAAHRNAMQFSVQSLEGLLEKVKTLSRDDLRAWREVQRGESARPLGLITGFPRSGTTLLEVILGADNRVALSSEASIFSDFVIAPEWDPQVATPPGWFTPPHSRRLAEQYWRLQEGNVGQLAGRVLIDKNPALTPLLGHFLNVLPEARLLFCLREPKDVLLSCYMQELPVNTVSVHFLEWQQCWHCYARCMEIWLRLRDLLDGGFMEIRYEELVADHRQVAAQALDFLGLSASAAADNYLGKVPGLGVYSPTYADVREPIHKSAAGRWTRYAAQFGGSGGVPLEDPVFRELGY